MDATIMPSITSLLPKLAIDFPQLTFSASDTFRWNPIERVIYYDSSSDDTSALLHEVAHGLLGHISYTKDVELLRVESDAWTFASNQLSSTYQVKIPDDTIQNALDTYRDWLHARSTCPQCQATGLQVGQMLYQCVACKSEWAVNEARTCALRRYKKHP
jgi:hypothetical protein